MFFSQKDIEETNLLTSICRSVLQVGFHCTALHCIALHHCYAMMNISEEERQAQHKSYWCHRLLEEEIESPTIYTYPNLFSESKEEEVEEEDEEEEVEEEEEDNNSTCRRQYTCFQCNVTISLISSSSSPLLLCPHCHAEFWEELEPLSPLLSTSNNPDLYSTPDISDVPEEDEDRYGNSSTVAVTKKKKKSEKEWRRVIFHKIRTFFGFAF